MELSATLAIMIATALHDSIEAADRAGSFAIAADRAELAASLWDHAGIRSTADTLDHRARRLRAMMRRP